MNHFCKWKNCKHNLFNEMHVNSMFVNFLLFSNLHCSWTFKFCPALLKCAMWFCACEWLHFEFSWESQCDDWCFDSHHVISHAIDHESLTHMLCHCIVLDCNFYPLHHATISAQILQWMHLNLQWNGNLLCQNCNDNPNESFSLHFSNAFANILKLFWN